MIERYTRPEMARLWSDEQRLATWLEVECLASEAMAAQGQIPAEAAATLRARARVDPARVREIEAVDLQALLSDLRDVDYAKAISELNQQYAGLQAAQAAYTRIAQLSLFDYLR